MATYEVLKLVEELAELRREKNDVIERVIRERDAARAECDEWLEMSQRASVAAGKLNHESMPEAVERLRAEVEWRRCIASAQATGTETIVTERDAARAERDVARAERAGAEKSLFKAIREVEQLRARSEDDKREYDEVCAKWDAARRERDGARAEVVAQGRELERWRHGETIESDFICPDSVALYEARAEVERLRAEQQQVCDWVGLAGCNSVEELNGEFGMALDSIGDLHAEVERLRAFVRAYDAWAVSEELCAGPLFGAMVAARDVAEPWILNPGGEAP